MQRNQILALQSIFDIAGMSKLIEKDKIILAQKILSLAKRLRSQEL